MKAQSTGPLLSTVFVDYDNIYLSLKRKNEEAARRFAKDSALWLKEIETGRLITPAGSGSFAGPRRIVLNRCYGNPVPRRNANDNSTDMNSFPFVRHHFQRAGFESIDCPPLTSQLKNSADIRIVMDIRDLLNHDTYFDEFIILSSDADFTPVLHRLRAHARRTVVYANDHTAAPYTAISDGEVREATLVAMLLEGRLPGETDTAAPASLGPSSAEIEVMRREIVASVVGAVRAAIQPVPLEVLADRAVRALGHDRTVGSAWGGAGSFRDLLVKGLPSDVRLSDQAPFVVYDASRQITAEPAPRTDVREPRSEPHDRRLETREPRYDARPEPTRDYQAGVPAAPNSARAETRPPLASPAGPSLGAPRSTPAAPERPAPQADSSYGAGYVSPRAPRPPIARDPAPQLRAPQASDPLAGTTATAIQQSIARIHEACQAPPLSPPEYRVLFEVMAEEIATNNLAGAQTLANIAGRAREMGLELRRDDVRFVLEVVSEVDPWFEQGVSASLFASRFRNFVVARCRAQGLSLSAQEIDLIDAWFGGGSPPGPRAAPSADPGAPAASAPQYRQPPAQDRYANLDEGRQHVAEGRDQGYGAHPDDEFPRIVRTRLRG
jgi:uncharacterized LabA/DUF88 family protein